MPPSEPNPPERPKASPLGIVLFVVYLAIYAGFVWLAAFRGSNLGLRPFGGVNLAIFYGMTLIIVPLILALIYLKWAHKAED